MSALSPQIIRPDSFNLLRPSDAWLRQQTKPSLFQKIASRLSGGKPFSETMLAYCQMGPWEQTSMKF